MKKTHAEIREVQNQIHQSKEALGEVKKVMSEVKTTVEENKESIHKVQQDQRNMSEDQKKSEGEITRLREQVDRLEANSRRHNFIIHGVPELGRGGIRERTEDLVVDILQRHMPDGEYHRDLVDKAFRIGQKQVGKDRPIVVKMERASEAASILGHKRGRASMKTVGYGLSQDLTKQQLETIRQLRGEGKVAYYLRGKLIVKEGDQATYRTTQARPGNQMANHPVQGGKMPLARALAIADQALLEQGVEEEDDCQIMGITKEGSLEQEEGKDEEKQQSKGVRENRTNRMGEAKSKKDGIEDNTKQIHSLNTKHKAEQAQAVSYTRQFLLTQLQQSKGEQFQVLGRGGQKSTDNNKTTTDTDKTQHEVKGITAVGHNPMNHGHYCSDGIHPQRGGILRGLERRSAHLSQRHWQLQKNPSLLPTPPSAAAAPPSPASKMPEKTTQLLLPTPLTVQSPDSQTKTSSVLAPEPASPEPRGMLAMSSSPTPRGSSGVTRMQKEKRAINDKTTQARSGVPPLGTASPGQRGTPGVFSSPTPRGDSELTHQQMENMWALHKSQIIEIEESRKLGCWADEQKTQEIRKNLKEKETRGKDKIAEIRRGEGVGGVGGGGLRQRDQQGTGQEQNQSKTNEEPKKQRIKKVRARVAGQAEKRRDSTSESNEESNGEISEKEEDKTAEQAPETEGLVKIATGGPMSQIVVEDVDDDENDDLMFVYYEDGKDPCTKSSVKEKSNVELLKELCSENERKEEKMKKRVRESVVERVVENVDNDVGETENNPSNFDGLDVLNKTMLSMSNASPVLNACVMSNGKMSTSGNGTTVEPTNLSWLDMICDGCCEKESDTDTPAKGVNERGYEPQQNPTQEPSHETKTESSNQLGTQYKPDTKTAHEMTHMLQTKNGNPQHVDKDVNKNNPVQVCPSTKNADQPKIEAHETKTEIANQSGTEMKPNTQVGAHDTTHVMHTGNGNPQHVDKNENQNNPIQAYASTTSQSELETTTAATKYKTQTETEVNTSRGNQASDTNRGNEANPEQKENKEARPTTSEKKDTKKHRLSSGIPVHTKTAKTIVSKPTQSPNKPATEKDTHTLAQIQGRAQVQK